MHDFVVRTPAQLGQLINGFRRERALSQQTLAERLGSTQQAVSRLEKEPATISVERLMKTLAALGVELVLRDKHGPVTTPSSTGSAAPSW